MLWGKEDKKQKKHNFCLQPMDCGGGGELDQEAHSKISVFLLGFNFEAFYV